MEAIDGFDDLDPVEIAVLDRLRTEVTQLRLEGILPAEDDGVATSRRETWSVQPVHEQDKQPRRPELAT